MPPVLRSIFVLAAAAAMVAATSAGAPWPVDPATGKHVGRDPSGTFDCAMKKLAYKSVYDPSDP